ncbi:MAG TPA: permease prefix domain 1-containing protein [Gammaproteobacteria bacterium]|nr:permease prefix domain 1-containing protein [Gammaproteobacteria bacterium]
MTILYRIRALVHWLFRRGEIERALDTDLADYIERSAAEKMRASMSEAEARRAARIELGGVEQTKESVRATLSFAPIDNTLADMGYALRTLRRQKTFTIVAVLTLALGTGVNVAIFSLAEQVLLRPLPVPEPGRLVNLSGNGPETRRTNAHVSAGKDRRVARRRWNRHAVQLPDVPRSRARAGAVRRAGRAQLRRGEALDG